MNPTLRRGTFKPCLVVAFAAAIAAAAPAWADLVAVVCEPEVRPAMKRWEAWRTGQGHRVAFVAPRTATTRFSRLPKERRPGERLTLLLVGDGERSGPPVERVAARIVSSYGPERDIASDRPYALRLGADAVGRLPFNERQSLESYLDRVLEREQSPVTWGDARLQIGAGVGGFSPLIDAAIEGAAANLVTRLAPPTAELSLMRFDPRRGSASPIEPATQRGGVWVWMGHGLRNQLPGVHPHEVANVTQGADVALLLACYAGDFSAPGRCVAEQMIASPDGPLAVVAATRVSMPYGNARLGAELLAGWRSQPHETIGGLLAGAQRRSLEEAASEELAGLDRLAGVLSADASSLGDERADHVMLYQLLGDPLLAIGRESELSIDAPDVIASEDTLVVRGVAPGAGWLRVELSKPVATRTRGDRPPVETVRAVETGERFAVSLTPNAAWRSGTRLIRVGIQSDEGLAIAAKRVTRRAVSRTAVTPDDIIRR